MVNLIGKIILSLLIIEIALMFVFMMLYCYMFDFNFYKLADIFEDISCWFIFSMGITFCCGIVWFTYVVIRYRIFI